MEAEFYLAGNIKNVFWTYKIGSKSLKMTIFENK